MQQWAGLQGRYHLTCLVVSLADIPADVCNLQLWQQECQRRQGIWHTAAFCCTIGWTHRWGSSILDVCMQRCCLQACPATGFQCLPHCSGAR